MVIAIIIVIPNCSCINYNSFFTLYGGNFTCAAVVAAIDADVARSPYTHTRNIYLFYHVTLAYNI